MSCPHINKVLESKSRDTVLKTYSTALKIVHYSNTSDNNDNNDNKKDDKLRRIRWKVLKCSHPNCHSSITYMCLQCSFVGCYNHIQSKNHSFQHAKSSNHIFAINSSNGILFCYKCDIPIYHQLLNYNSLSNNLKLINENSRLPSFKEFNSLKGFINLGATCFMSSILQSIIHNPFIRNYYLNGYHNHINCNIENCLSCSLNLIFQDFFTNPSIIPFGITNLIENSWKIKKSLAGYTEQDAHEFWQFLIHQIHKNSKNDLINKNIENNANNNNNNTNTSSSSSTSISPSPSTTNLQHNHSNNCQCIIHKTFSGTLKSTLKCTVCGKFREIIDPMLDLSLEIQDLNNNNLTNLNECLKKFTNIELLDELYYCNYCEKRTKVTKNLKLNKLPKILSIQLKRFKHFGISSKLDHHIDIPLILNINDYLSNNETIINYELFSIICHIGNVNTGHYLAYVKNNNGLWFKFDDANVTRVSESFIKKVNGYMLFYCMVN